MYWSVRSSAKRFTRVPAMGVAIWKPVAGSVCTAPFAEQPRSGLFASQMFRALICRATWMRLNEGAIPT